MNGSSPLGKDPQREGIWTRAYRRAAKGSGGFAIRTGEPEQMSESKGRDDSEGYEEGVDRAVARSTVQ